MTLTGFRRLQVLVALAVTLLFASALVLGSGILLPGIMGVFLTPVGIVYLVFAVLALRGQTAVARVAGWFSLVVALVLGVMGLARLGVAVQFDADVPTAVTAVGPDGEPVVFEGLPESVREDFARRQRALRRSELLSAAAILVTAAGALAVAIAEASARRRRLGPEKRARTGRAQ